MELTQTMVIKDLRVHPLAETTPTYTQVQYNALLRDIELNGQQVAAVVYKDFIIDGRHRYRALSELEQETIKVTVLPDNTTDAELTRIIHSLETRRHETASQLAIKAWYDYMDPKTTGTMSSFADKHGASLANINRANKIGGTKANQFMRPDILELLFNGEKFPIENYIETDSLTAIESFLRKMQLNRKAKLTGMVFDTDALSESEQDLVDAAVLKFADESVRVRKALAKRLYSSIPREIEDPTE